MGRLFFILLGGGRLRCNPLFFRVLLHIAGLPSSVPYKATGSSSIRILGNEGMMVLLV